MLKHRDFVSTFFQPFSNLLIKHSIFLFLLAPNLKNLSWSLFQKTLFYSFNPLPKKTLFVPQNKVLGERIGPKFEKFGDKILFLSWSQIFQNLGIKLCFLGITTFIPQNFQFWGLARQGTNLKNLGAGRTLFWGTKCLAR